jgi:hypothetical protein
MRLRELTIPRPDGSGHRVAAVRFEPDDIELLIVLQRAEELAAGVNVHAPGGRARTPDEIRRASIAWLVAEAAFTAYLRLVIASHRLANVSVWSAGYNPASEQIDLDVHRDGTLFPIEMRSSHAYKTSEARIYNAVFSVIGWYSHRHKPGETPKPFYARALFHFPPEEIDVRAQSGIEVRLVGGATREMLEGPLGGFESFKQERATYRTIKPITAALDIVDFADVVLGVSPAV